MAGGSAVLAGTGEALLDGFAFAAARRAATELDANFLPSVAFVGS